MNKPGQAKLHIKNRTQDLRHAVTQAMIIVNGYQAFSENGTTIKGNHGIFSAVDHDGWGQFVGFGKSAQRFFMSAKMNSAV